VLATHTTIPLERGWRTRSERHLANAFMHAQESNGDLRRVFFLARLATVLEGAAVGWLIALLAIRLFGPGAETLPALLWFLNPFSIGLSHIVGIDLPFTLTVLVTALAVTWARDRPSLRRCAVVGVCGGLSVLTRLTGVFVVPLAALAVAFADQDDRVRRGVVALASSWLTLAGVYLAVAPAAAIDGVLGTVANIAVPPDWRAGSRYLLHVGSMPGPAFILGRFHVGRWLFFWPASLLVKLPPLTLLVLVVSPLLWWRLSVRSRREALWVLVLPALVLGVFTIQQQRPIGLRYLLATIALGIVCTGALAIALQPRARQLVTAAVAAGGLAAVLTGPALAWTSPLVGRGYTVAADSNLDWGQGFSALQRWAVGKRPWVSYFGGAGLDVQELPGARKLGRGPAGVRGWTAVSASDLYVYRRDDLAWLRDRCPVRVLAKTILIYDIEPGTTSCAHESGSVALTRWYTRVTP